MGVTSGQRIDRNRVRVLRGQWHIPSKKIDSATPLPSPLGSYGNYYGLPDAEIDPLRLCYNVSSVVVRQKK